MSKAHILRKISECVNDESKRSDRIIELIMDLALEEAKMGRFQLVITKDNHSDLLKMFRYPDINIITDIINVLESPNYGLKVKSCDRDWEWPIDNYVISWS